MLHLKCQELVSVYSFSKLQPQKDRGKFYPNQFILLSMRRLLEVKDLKVSFSIQGRKLQAVRDISFNLLEGEAIGIVGESGCGKSAAVSALVRLVPEKAIEAGRVLLEGKDILQMKEKELLSVRGQKIGMIFQDPMTSLNPTMKIGDQIIESLLYHRISPKKEAKKRALELLELVGIPEPALRYSQYPHELSGGMRQRVLIAIAIAPNPKILIADEPTTALDPTLQAQILHLLKDLQKRLKMSLIIISHDIGVVASLADRLLVMYAGKIIETGSAQDVLTKPRHPYTEMLLRSLPRIDLPSRLIPIEGSPPDLFSPPKGCPFAARCERAMNICKQKMPSDELVCHLHDPKRLLQLSSPVEVSLC